jgi:hypothetical protein
MHHFERQQMNAAMHPAVESASNQDPAIILAGRSWPVPRLAPRQNKIVVPVLLRLIPRILRARDEALAAQESDLGYLGRLVDEATYEQLATIAHTALTRARPDLTRAEFDDMSVETLELIGAVFVIARQAGLLRPAQPRNPGAGHE